MVNRYTKFNYNSHKSMPLSYENYPFWIAFIMLYQ